ncbi:sporulation integral membrane protein YtvI [Lentibacillus sp. JNUCC-1]|uniref:sporulation integral membrane protein YtvI n=1 Tax=Lentibacillus sp. JNUCC-1 TaxID=2654513 RepID=UPI0018D1FFCF|nr:sporulation integral membrane protein YtvI [Lentibacillus sp. JNUCC-1]
MGKRELNMLLRLFLVLSILLAGYFLVKWTLLYLYPFVIACFLAAMLNPLVTFIEQKTPVPRGVAAAAVMCTALLLTFAGLFFLAGELFQGTAYLARKLPEHMTAFAGYLQEWIKTFLVQIYDKILSLFNGLNVTQKEAVLEQIDHLLVQASGAGSALIQNLLMHIPSLLSIFPLSMTLVVLIFLATFFMTNDWPAFSQLWKDSAPGRIKSSSLRLWQTFIETLIGWLKAQVILVFFSTLTIYIGLLLLQVEHALTIAVLIALVDLVPLVGTGIVFIPWIFYLFMSGQYTMTIGLSILYMSIVIGRQFAEPKILSSHIGVNPLIALIGLFIGFRLFGFWGLFLTPFMLIIFSTFVKTGVFRSVGQFILDENYHLR